MLVLVCFLCCFGSDNEGPDSMACSRYMRNKYNALAKQPKYQPTPGTPEYLPPEEIVECYFQDES